MSSSPPTQLVDSAGFRSMMARFPSGVSVVAAYGTDGTPHGMTCTSLCSVSLEPPTLLVCLRNGSATLDAVLSSGAFTVNLLHTAARAAAELFGSGRQDRFDVTTWSDSPTGAGPCLTADALAVADCRVDTTHLAGTHTVVFGKAVHLLLRPGRPPLLHGLRAYADWPFPAP
ncbi:flavin reductase family protein [Streptomyces morookaense]|uniref:Flavin reductase family protein n=1 Tax=Streptomyces morookaense TaxID=1970 RepID=A0A7Y7B267_STRMO|nr:flavin reductase family protein [Streptomyces morookaense]NVK77515.1 flavin reductase family protein [Streptomyces morookaense]GHF22211.1 FMN reductase (NADH) RutF [Streptomyces morookaense]